MNKRDYYEVLGVDKTTPKAEIKKKYRKLAKEYHPDRNKSADAETKFKEIKEAYEILSDEQKRAAYDQYGHAGTEGFSSAGTNGFGGFGGYEDLSDIFSQFFGGGFGGFQGGGFGGFNSGFNQQSSSAARGADLEVNLKIKFLDAVFGTEKTIGYKRYVTCDVCNGTGAKDNSKIETCPTCNGQGRIVRVQKTFLGNIQTASVCPECRGEGKIIKEKCEKCKGETRIQTDTEFKLKIPSGIPDGITLRFRDKGNSGQKGGNSGDLYINIEVEPDERFERQGNDIYTNLDIDVYTATLGGKVTVDTVHGRTNIKIPAGTQSGKIIKLSNKGGPKFRENGNGDQYIKVNVEIPSQLNRNQRKLWEELRNM